MKKNFAEPEMDVVRFNAEIVIATSGGGCSDCSCDTSVDSEGEILPFPFF